MGGVSARSDSDRVDFHAREIDVAGPVGVGGWQRETDLHIVATPSRGELDGGGGHEPQRRKRRAFLAAATERRQHERDADGFREAGCAHRT